jgi:hypothetical protein
MANKAHIYKSKAGSYNMSFHHPICREGSIGKKIHRSLRVTDALEAERLRQQIDELLAVADETPSLLPTRSSAIAEHKYDPAILDAFYDCVAPEPVNYFALRERAMQLPTSIRNDGQVPHVHMVGATGVGKSRLLQHLLQTTAANFPMRGAGRTTVADTETIVGDFDFSAVITIFSKNEIREIVKENILEACSFANRDNDDKAKIASKLLVDSDNRFRFNYVLGGWPTGVEQAFDDDIVSEEEETVSDGQTASDASTWAGLERCVDEVVSMTKAALAKARAQCEPSDEEDDVVDELLLQNIDQDRLDDLTEEILGELERRLCAATREASWPVVHRIAETPDQDEFFDDLAPFSQNRRSLFGALVTPLVQGIRSRGRFYPPSWAADEPPTWVLIDGQGIGHERTASTKIDRIVPPELATKFSGADVICLVDRSAPAMVGDAPILLQHLVTRGYLDRLALVFTHFEAVNAPDLDARAKRDKVLEGLSTTIQGIATLPKGQRVLFERTAEDRAYFLTHLDFDEIKSKPTRAGLRGLCDRIRSCVPAPEFQPVRPLFNEYQIANVVQREIEEYRQAWSVGELASYQYKIMWALTNRIGNAYSDGYPKQNLYPGQDLAQRLVSAISIELENPKDWDPRPPQNLEEQSRILNAIRTKVADDIDLYCRDVLVRDPRVVAWLPAYKDIFGKGTKVRRARAIARILEDHAQLPDEGVGKFTNDIWRIVEAAIKAVCISSEGPETAAA